MMTRMSKKVRGKIARSVLSVVTMFTLMSALTPVRVAYAGDGDLDGTFGTGGKVTTDVSDGQINAVAVQTDGKIVVAGTALIGGNDFFAVARYNSDGTLDPSFDGDGFVVTDVGAGDEGKAIAIQTDGQIVVAGTSNDDIAVVRYNGSNGALDTSFDTDGKVIIDIAGGADSGNAVAIQTDNKIVVAGTSNDDIAVVRYNGSNGALDTSFDTDGKVTVDIAGGADSGNAVAIQTDNKIVVVGTALIAGDNDIVVVRYNTSGVLDASFFAVGMNVTDFGLGANDQGNAVAIQTTDNKIVVAGTSNDDFAVVRYNGSDGDRDRSFDTDGKATTDVVQSSSFKDSGNAVAIQTDGKIVVAGTSCANINCGAFINPPNDFALVRYNSNGTLDTSFNSDGIVTTNITVNDRGNAAAIQTDGRIVVAGKSNDDSANDFALVRYNSGFYSVGGTVSGLLGSGLELQNNGGDDLAIGANGPFTFTTKLANGAAYAVSVKTQPTAPAQTCTVTNGTATIPGADVTNVTVTCTAATFRVGGTVSGLTGSGLVLQNNGGDDLAIGAGANGSFTFATKVADGSAYAVTVKTQPGAPLQSCVVTNGAGTIPGADVTNVTVTCTTGTFNVGGAVSGLTGSGLVLQNNGGDDLAIGAGANGPFTFATKVADGSAYAVTVKTQPGAPAQGCTVANGAGTIMGADVTNVTVTCNTITFGLDTTFGVGGKATTNIGIGATPDVGHGVVIQLDGKIVVVGTSNDGANDHFALVRYNSDGTPDAGFGANGVVITVFNGAAQGNAVAIDANGKIVVAGTSDGDFAVARYNSSNGSPDTTFGGTGMVVTDFNGLGGNFTTAAGHAVAIDANNRIVVAGFVRNGSEFNDFALVRYSSNGALDSTFGLNGIVTSSIQSQQDDQAYAVAIQPADGKIIVVGDTKGAPGQFVMVRYSSIGTLDTTFGASGIVFAASTKVGPGRAVLLTGIGPQIVVAGAKSVLDPNSNNCLDSAGRYCEYLDFWVARYNNDGSTDNGIGVNGEVTTGINIRGNDDQGRAVAIEIGSSKIVVAGYSDTSIHTFRGEDESFSRSNDFALARYNRNGTPDTTFDTGGRITTGFSAGSDDEGHAGAIQTDGKIIVAGASDRDFALARYKETAATFKVGGMVSGLTGSGLVLQNNAGDDLTIGAGANGAFTFATKLAGGSPYVVTVKTQPGAPVQSCIVTKGAGTIAGAIVSNVAVTCTMGGNQGQFLYLPLVAKTIK